MLSAFIRSLAIASVAAGVVAGIASAAPAGALPECTNTSVTTTQCERPGNAQINTGPPFINDYPQAWPFWGNGISISLGGLGLGF
jgi:hypothetical protein